jgi:hypothetical protein
MEAVFQPENFRIFSGDLLAFPGGKNGKLARNQWKKSEDFPAGILFPYSVDFQCFPAGTGPCFLTWDANRAAIKFNEISRKRIEEICEREKKILSKMTRSLQRLEGQKLKLNQVDNRGLPTYIEPSEHFEGLFLK